jgi:hypothetical protein
MTGSIAHEIGTYFNGDLSVAQLIRQDNKASLLLSDGRLVGCLALDLNWE